MDPNEVVGTPTERQIWLAPDWSKHGTTAAMAGPGATQVSTRTVTYRNGRIVTYVLDENHNPITTQALSEDTDPDLKKAWDEKASQATPNNGSPTQKRQGPDGVDHIYQWNPTTRQYDNDLGAVAGTGPPGGKPYIDDGAEAGKSGRRWGWNQQTHAYDRDLGPSPAAQQGPASKRDPVAGHPGIYTVTAADPNNPNAVSTHYENEAGQTVPQPPEFKPGTLVDDGHGGKVMVTQDPATGAVRTQPVQGVAGKPDQVTANGVVYERGADGTYAPAKGLPTSRPGQMVDIDGRKFWATPNADPSQPPTLTPMNPGPGTQPRDNGPQFEPGMKASDYLAARRQYWMDQRRAGVSQADINAGWAQDVQIANAQQNQESTAASQQNQRLTSALTGYNEALTSNTDINRYLPVGSDLAGKGLAADLLLQRAQAQRMGGYGPMGPAAPGPDPSSQVAAIPAAPAPAAVAPVSRPAPTQPAFSPPPPVGADPMAPIPGVHLVSPPSPRPAVAATPSAARPASAPVSAAAVAAPAVAAPTIPVPSPLPAADEFGRTPASGGATATAPEYWDPSVGTSPPINMDPSQGPVGMLPSGAVPVAAIPESPYDFAARIASTPPWMMSEQDHNQAQALGLGDSFWSVPRGQPAGVGAVGA